MHYSPNIRPASVTGPLGEKLTPETLPSRNTVRWTARRKAQVVTAVNANMLSAHEACKWYGLTLEELEEWRRASDCGGVLALRITRSQDYAGNPRPLPR